MFIYFCIELTCISASPTCEPLTQFSCSNGRCVSVKWHCDSGKGRKSSLNCVRCSRPERLCICMQTMTAATAATKRDASSLAPTPSSSARVAAVSPTTGPAMGTTTVETSATRTRPAEVDQHVRRSLRAVTAHLLRNRSLVITRVLHHSSCPIINLIRSSCRYARVSYCQAAS